MASAIPANQASFSIAELIRVTGAQLRVAGARAEALELPQALERENIVGVGTDTRAPLAGGLFVALRGERFDGHRFVADAERAGARALLVEEDVAAERALVLKVPSTLAALGALGRDQRVRWGGKLVAVAGSVGKTTTRSATALLLGASGARVHSPRGNLNNAIGVPLVLLGLLPEHRYAVVEIGTNLPGEVAALSALAQPDVGVLTRIALEHTQGLGDLDGIELEEGALLGALGKDGIAIANGDDRRCQNQLRASAAGLKLSYGTSPGRDYRILECVTGSARGTRLRIQRLDGDELVLDNPLLGLPGAYALAAALAVSETLLEQRLQQADLERALSSPELGEPGRLCPLELANGVLVLDDTYNASPASVLSSVEVARELASRRGGRLLLALGEMRELGELSESAHRELGEQLVDTRPALIVGFGGHAELLLRAPAARGIDTRFALDAPAALELLRERLQAGDVILVKASRSLGAERIVRGLVAAGGGRV